MGLAVDAHVGDGVEPVAGGGVERAEVGDVESGEEVLLHVADAGLDAAFGKGCQLQPIRTVSSRLYASPTPSIRCSGVASSC